MKQVLSQELAQIWRFLKSGLPTLAVYYLFYLSLTQLGVWYIYASWFASFTASIVTFLLQKFYVFKEPDKKQTLREAIWFIVLGAMNRIVNSLALYYLVDLAGFSVINAQILLTVVTAFFAYIAFGFIFKKN